MMIDYNESLLIWLLLSLRMLVICAVLLLRLLVILIVVLALIRIGLGRNYRHRPIARVLGRYFAGDPYSLLLFLDRG